MLPLNNQKNIYYSLRIACAMCFIGHGAFGIITKEIWCNYFAVFDISHDVAYAMMPPVGIIDICFGLMIIFFPLRIVFGWLVFWGAITASLRPLSGEPFAEFIERAGNYGAPLALLLLTVTKENVKWFKPVTVRSLQPDDQILKHVKLCLQIVVFLLIAGHGCLNLIEKKSLLSQYKSLGFANAADVAHIIGSLEILAAVSVLIKPVPSIIFMLFVWKVISELFYPHWEIFEFIERGGSYGSILALWFLTKNQTKSIINEKKFSKTVSIIS